jgi:hypothetical protein
MKKEIIISIILIAFILSISPILNKMTGKVIGGPGNFEGDKGYGGPSAEDSACLKKCVVDEGRAEGVCMNECGVEPEPTNVGEDEKCMQDCIKQGCDDERDFNCQRANVEGCEGKCEMKGDAPDESEMSEEQKCISDCVAAVDPSIICGSGSYEGEGEIGNSVCQECANSCVHLYEGPCLTDELWREKEDACMAQGEHMEAAPVMGDSGEDYECTVDLDCIDRGSEFGDEPGEGPGIGQEGYVAPSENILEKIGDFFKGLFGGK